MRRPPSRFAKLIEPGTRFGYLTVMHRASSIGKYAAWCCMCDCGVAVVATGQKLRRGLRKACAVNGHQFRENWGRRYTGDVSMQKLHPREYKSWENMRERCNNPRQVNYRMYGARGITVCERWARFAAFFEDMGKKPTAKHTVDRIDNDGNYEPGNCRWATPAEQSRNMRTNGYVEWNGQRMLLLDVVKQFGISRNLVYCRLKLGWSLEQALALPSRPHRKKSLDPSP